MKTEIDEHLKKTFPPRQTPLNRFFVLINDENRCFECILPPGVGLDCIIGNAVKLNPPLIISKIGWSCHGGFITRMPWWMYYAMVNLLRMVDSIVTKFYSQNRTITT